MGQNLSTSEKFADTSKAALAPFDKFSDMLLGIIWGLSIYGIGMIFCAIALLGRWAGKHGERGVNFFSILAAFILSVGWPVILIYLSRTSDTRR